MKKDTATDFMLYSFMGITLNDREKTCVFACIMKAYFDATNQGAYNTQIKDLHEVSNEAKKKAATYLYEECRKRFTQQNSQSLNFDTWHENLCEELVNCYEKVNNSKTDSMIFTFGNAQKWVNMTLKYMDLLVSMGMLKSYKDLIEKNRSKFHIPIDSYILYALWNDEGITNELKEKFPCDKEKYPHNSEHNHALYKVTGWSNWSSYDIYKDFKNDVIEKLKTMEDPFDYENEIWIEEAKRRKAKETEDRIKSFFTDKIIIEQ